jgi:NAD(P)-dependent dehydrogenase (short-subunit alcohol dehydrogenase family)
VTADDPLMSDVAPLPAPRVLITGAARGLGRALALAFAARGSSVALVDACGEADDWSYPLARRAELADTAALCRGEGVVALEFEGDVRSLADLEGAARETIATFGGIDVLISNAGVIGPEAVRAHEIAEDDWLRVLDVNLSGAWRAARAVLPTMLEQRSGCLLFTASTGGLAGFPRFSSYVASKHGIVGLVRALAAEYGEAGIRANAVCPTVIDDGECRPAMMEAVADMEHVRLTSYRRLSHQWHPLGRLVSAAEVVSAYLWLASPAAGGVTGVAVPVDAGYLAR